MMTDIERRRWMAALIGAWAIIGIKGDGRLIVEPRHGVVRPPE